MHAAAVAKELGINRIIIPKHPGLFSARGISTADFNHDYIRSVIGSFWEMSPETILDILLELEENAHSDLDAEKIDSKNRQLIHSFDLRYIGQTTEINIPVIWNENNRVFEKEQIIDKFHKSHRDRYSYNVEDEPVELVNIRLRAIGRVDKPPLREVSLENGLLADAKERQVLLPGTKVSQTVPVYQRDSLNAERKLIGPAIIEESSSTTIVLEEMEISVDKFENIIIQLILQDDT